MSAPRAYFRLGISPQDTADIVLPYKEEGKTFANGRVLVVAVPKYSKGRKPSSVDLIAKPTDLEFRQLHKLGVHLVRAAMRGHKDSIAHEWREHNKSHTEIAVPHVFMVKKMHGRGWTIGYFDQYGNIHNSGYHIKSERPINNVQTLADRLCASIDIPSVKLGRPRATTPLPRFPARKQLLSAYRNVGHGRVAAKTQRDRKTLIPFAELNRA